MSVSIIEVAKSIAYVAHDGQKRDDGMPFITHPEKVAQIIALVAPDDENLIAAAWLHDTIEDADMRHEYLDVVFGSDVADLVHEVTQEGRRDSHGHYFPRLHTQRGIMLKFADRLSNISDMNGWDEKRKSHYLRKSKFWKGERELK